MSLPTLPHPVYHIVSQGELIGYMSAEQMQAYGQQCRSEALEEAAQACESRQIGYASHHNVACAAEIRSLKS